jgi:cytoplasmic iron level regulating protein YaaA (DUF328/UPF0246 family)
MYFYPMNKPLILLSPSKGMRTEAAYPYSAPRPLIFPEQTEKVVAAVQKLPERQAQALFKVSDKLWPEVHAMWSKEPGHYLCPNPGLAGIHAYSGEAFKFLNSETLSERALARAQDRLVILSALYGTVHADAVVVPYRLEMLSKLAAGKAKNLYALWKPVLTAWLNEGDADFVVDACSGEYSKAINWKAVEKPVVAVDFKQRKNGQLKSVSAFSKQARGAFVRWMLETDVHTISGLEAFNELGYELHSNEDNKLVFLRDSD